MNDYANVPASHAVDPSHGGGNYYGREGTLLVYVPDGRPLYKISNATLTLGDNLTFPLWLIVLGVLAFLFRAGLKPAWKALTKGGPKLLSA